MAKQVSLQILRILEENTDMEHMLSKQDILQKLADRYETYIEEGAFYRKIEELEEAGYDRFCRRLERIRSIFGISKRSVFVRSGSQ